MRAGNLDTRIALQRSTPSLSTTGEPVEVWTLIAERWASVAPASGSEVNAAEQWIAREQTKFTIRWSATVDDLSPKDRVICDASETANSPIDDRAIYDIISVHETVRRETVVIIAARRVA